jgi:hypothetical protein
MSLPTNFGTPAGGTSRSMGTPAGTLKKSGYEQINLPRLTPQQMQLFSQVFSGIQPGLSQGLGHLGGLAGGDPNAFAELEAPTLRQFGDILGGIGSRFSGGLGQSSLGRMPLSAQKSSAFQNELTGAAGNLAERLAGQRLGLQQNAISQLLGLYQNLMGTQPYENLLIEKKRTNPWGSALTGAASGASAGSVFGPWGTAAGGLLGGVGGYLGGS